MAASDYLYPTGTYQVRAFDGESVTSALAYPPSTMTDAETGVTTGGQNAFVVTTHDKEYFAAAPPETQ